MSHAIEIGPTTLGDRGQRYRVTYLGKVLVESTRNPEFDASRALLAWGVTGTLEIWRRGKSAPDARLDIQRGAKLTVHENDTGLRLARWEPRTGDDAQMAPLSCGGRARTADGELAATLG
jgi:hypothetical protein